MKWGSVGAVLAFVAVIVLVLLVSFAISVAIGKALKSAGAHYPRPVDDQTLCNGPIYVDALPSMPSGGFVFCRRAKGHVGPCSPER